MRFKYIGEEESVSIFKLTFPKGMEVEVTDEHAIGKLRNNRHFELCDTTDEKTPDVNVTHEETAPEPPKRRGGWPLGRKRV